MKHILSFSLLLTLLSCHFERMPQGLPVFYQYGYYGMRSNPILWLRADRDPSGTPRLSYVRNQFEITIIRAPEDIFLRIDSLARKARLNRLKDRYTPLANIKDGNSWSLNLKYEQGSISSHGSNAWPSRELRDGIDAINAYLESLADAAGEEDIIGKEPYR